MQIRRLKAKAAQSRLTGQCTLSALKLLAWEFVSSGPWKEKKVFGSEKLPLEEELCTMTNQAKLSLFCLVIGLGVLLAFASPALAQGPEIDLALGMEDLRIVGDDNTYGWLGEITASGDMNGDGYEDILVGAAGFNWAGRVDCGAAYVILGSDTLSGVVDLNATDADLTIYGGNGPAGGGDIGDALGHTLASGDINGDGYADVIVGADGWDQGSLLDVGIVYVFLGHNGSWTTTTKDMAYDTADLTIIGEYAWGRLGRAVASGDVNGDGYDDLIIGAYKAITETGVAYVILGSPNITTTTPTTINLATDDAALTIVGASVGDRLGRSVAVGDVNSDTIADIIVGAYLADLTSTITNTGKVYVITGSTSITTANPITIDLSVDQADYTLNGIDTGDEAGFYVSSGDVDGNGYDDVIISAYKADAYWAGTESGEVYIVYGNNLTTTMYLSSSADITIYAASAGERLGRSAASGSSNGDGYDDILIGAPRAAPDGKTRAGRAYLIYGSPSLSTTINLSETGSADVVILGDDSYDEAGRSAAFGDINGDGYEDFIFGALGYDIASYNDVGAAYVIWGGGPITLSIAPSSTTVYEGDAVTYILTATNNAGSRDVSQKGIFDITSGAGGTWSQNVYTTEVDGAWIVTATYQGLNITATLNVLNITPTAVISGPTTANEGDSLEFDASLSSDPGNDIVSYEWDFVYNGTFVSDATGITATYAYTDNGSYTLALQVTDDDGASGITTTVITINNVAPVVDAGPDQTVDEGATVNFSGSFTDPGTGDTHDILWDFGDGGTITGTLTPSHVYAEPGTFTVTLVVTDDDGGVGSDTTLVTVNNLAPTADAGGPYTGDEGASITLDGSGSSDPGGGTLSYAWDLDNDGQYDDAFTATTSYTWAEPGTYTVGLVVTDSEGLTDTDTAQVTVNNLAPTADAGGPYTGNEGASIALDGSGSADPGGGTLSYAWDLDNDGQYDDAFTASTSYTWAEPGTYTVGLVVTDSEGLTDTDTAQVTVNNLAPTADAGGPYTGDEGASITLDGGSSSDPGGGTLSYAWDLDNDGQYDDAFTASTSYTWAEPGVYTVSLVVTDSEGLTDTDTAQVTVNNLAPTAEAGGPYTGEAGTPITLDASGSFDPGGGTLSYAWDLDNDGQYDDAVGITVTQTWSNAGQYTVGLRVTDDDGGEDTDTAEVTVTPAGLAYIVISPDTATITAGEVQTYTAEAFDAYGNSLGDVTAGTTFTIEAGAGGSWTDNIYTSEKAGTWTVTGVYADVTDTATLTVTTAALDHIVISPDTASIAAGEVQTYTAEAFDAYDNSLGDVTASTIFTIESAAGGSWTDNVYMAEKDGAWIITGTYSSLEDTALLTVTNVAPTAAISGPSTGDEGEALTFDGSGSTDPGNDIVSYEWDFDYDGSFNAEATGAIVAYVYTNDGVYTLALRVSDDNGATDIATATVTVNNVAPVVQEVTNTGPAGEGSPITVTVTASDAGEDTLTYGFDWNNDGDFNDPGDIANQSSNQASHTWNDDGTYTVRVVVYDDDTHTETTHQVTVNNVAPTADAGGPYFGAAGTPITLDASGSTDLSSVDVLTYAWDLDNDGEYDDAIGAIVTHTWNAAGTYTVGVQVEDDDGGIGTDTAQVVITSAGLAYIVISPDAATIAAGEVQTYTAEAFDAYGNSLGDVTASTVFTIEAAAGGSWSGNSYTSEKAGTWTVTGIYSGISDTAILTVSPAALDHIVISPAEATVRVGESITYTVEAFDAYDNSLGDVTASTDFTIEAGAGGSWTGNVYTAEVEGEWEVTATYEGVQDTTILRVLAPADPHPYKIYLPAVLREMPGA